MQRPSLNTRGSQARSSTPKTRSPSTPKGRSSSLKKTSTAVPTKAAATGKKLRSGMLNASELRERAQAWTAAHAAAAGAHDKSSLAARVASSLFWIIVNKNLVRPQDLFEMVDTDSSGLIDRNEWFEACKQLLPGAEPAGIIALFEVIDEDASGEIDLSELAAGLEKLQDVASSSIAMETAQQACAQAASRAAQAKDSADEAEVTAAAVDKSDPGSKGLQENAASKKALAEELQQELREKEQEARAMVAKAKAARATKAQDEVARAANGKAEAAPHASKEADAVPSVEATPTLSELW